MKVKVDRAKELLSGAGDGGGEAGGSEDRHHHRHAEGARGPARDARADPAPGNHSIAGVLPAEDPQQVQREIEDALARHGVDDVEVESCRIEKGALGTPDSDASVRACRSALEVLSLPTESAAVAFGTDAGIFAQEGLPGVVFGPGSIKEAHTDREYVEVSQVETAVEFFVTLLEARN